MAGRGRGDIFIEPGRLDGGADGDIGLLAAIAIRALHDARGQLGGVDAEERPKVQAEAVDFLRWFRDAWGIQIEA